MREHFKELCAEFRKTGWSDFQNAREDRDRQIKGECQLTDLAKGVEFITQKSDEYEKDRREKDAIIVALQSELKNSNIKVEDLEKKIERQEQYSRRNCIIIHGLKEEKKESTNDKVVRLFREELNEDVLFADLDRTHRIGKRKTQAANHVQLS